MEWLRRFASARATRSTTGRHIGVGVTVLLTACVVTPAFAQSAPDTLRLADAVALTREANPMLQAARLRADAARERVTQAGALPDPQLSLALMNRPLDFATDQPMTMNSVQWMQRLPWPGKLGFAEERERHLAEADALDADETERQLVARVKALYYRLAYVDRAIAIMESTRELLRNFLDVSSTRYAVGDGLQQDVLQAQVAVAQMTEDITVMQQNRIALAARLNALFGRAATVPVPALELPEPRVDLPPVDALMDRAVSERPAVAAARARVEAAEAGYRAARRMIYPDFTITVGYGQRPQFVDLATLMVGISIPLWAGSRQLPLRREMEAMQSAATARERDLYNDTYARLTELRAEADRARSLTGLYASDVLPQARAAVESALSAYRVGRVDYTTLVNNEMTVNRYEIEAVRLTADYHRAVAEIEALVGSDLGGTQ
ncbi:MAG: TolC family protein [Gemmatimonadales bacterium]|jgi:outer membrane protein TolC